MEGNKDNKGEVRENFSFNNKVTSNTNWRKKENNSNITNSEQAKLESDIKFKNYNNNNCNISSTKNSSYEDQNLKFNKYTNNTNYYNSNYQDNLNPIKNNYNSKFYQGSYNENKFSTYTLTWKTRYSNYEDQYKLRKIDEDNNQFLDEHLKALEKKLEHKNIQEEILIYNNKLNLIESENEKIFTFEDLYKLNKIDDNIKYNIESMKFQKLTPIQTSVIPIILKGSDLMGCAQTGSGKTVAFMLPVINKLLLSIPKKPSLKKTSYPQVLVLVPTRELVDQIFRVTRLLTANTGLSIVSLYGGVGHEEQIKDLKSGADILISTTGRILDFLQSKIVILEQLDFMIIDEADRLLEMGFEKQLNEILTHIPSKIQILLFSATFSKEIRATAYGLLKENFIIASPNINDNDFNKNIDQYFEYVEERDKLQKLHSILQESEGSVIGIFLIKFFLIEKRQ